MSLPEKVNWFYMRVTCCIPHEAVIAYPLVCAKRQYSRKEYVVGDGGLNVALLDSDSYCDLFHYFIVID